MGRVNSIRISSELALPLEAATLAQAILARRGAGKSYLASVFAEELLDVGYQVVAIDPVGAWWGLRASSDGAGAGYPIAVLGGDHADVPLEENAGEIVARAIVEERFSCVLDLSKFRKGEAQRFMTAFLETLYRLNRAPMHLIIDEADTVAPQKPYGDQARLLGAAEDIVRRGRQRGIGCTLITQRPQVLAKDVLTQCEILTTLRIGHPRDLAAVREWIEVQAESASADEQMESLPSLPTGTAWVWSPSLGIHKRAVIRKRKTFDSGATPKPGAKLATPKTLAEVDVQKLGAAISATAQRAKENDPTTLRARLADAERRLAEKKFERVEVPTISADQIREVQALARGLEALGKSIIDQLKTIVEQVVDSAQRLLAAIESGRVKMANSHSSPPIPRREMRKPRPTTRGNPRNDGGELPTGERAILTATLQLGSVTREQLTQLTGYKRSSRDAYIQRLAQRGYVEVGSEIVPTQSGVAALPNVEPLPTGDDLLRHWLGKLPEGERRILEEVAANHPAPVSRESLSEKTGYQRSSRDAYIQRLAARRLLELVGRGEVRAAAILFD